MSTGPSGVAWSRWRKHTVYLIRNINKIFPTFYSIKTHRKHMSGFSQPGKLARAPPFPGEDPPSPPSSGLCGVAALLAGGCRGSSGMRCVSFGELEIWGKRWWLESVRAGFHLCVLTEEWWWAAGPGLLHGTSSSVSPVDFRHRGDNGDANCKRDYLTAVCSVWNEGGITLIEWPILTFSV